MKLKISFWSHLGNLESCISNLDSRPKKDEDPPSIQLWRQNLTNDHSGASFHFSTRGLIGHCFPIYCHMH